MIKATFLSANLRHFYLVSLLRSCSRQRLAVVPILLGSLTAGGSVAIPSLTLSMVALAVSASTVPAHAQPLPAPQDYAQKSNDFYKQQLAPILATDFKGALFKAQTFLDENPDMGVQCMHLYKAVGMGFIDISKYTSKKPVHEDNVAALAFMDEGIQKLTQAQEQFPIDIDFLQFCSASILLNDDQNEAGAKRIEDNWTNALTYGDTRAWVELRRDCYLQQGRETEIVPMLQSAIEERIKLKSKFDPILCRIISETLRDQDRAADSLSWAKLNYMLCPFADDDISAATQTLTSAWMYTMAAAEAKNFVTAQTDAATANPLKPVALPVFNPKTQQVLKEAIGRAKKDKDISTLVPLLVAQGDFRGAMVQARSQLAGDQGTEISLRQVALVFKAKDLSLVRANQFLGFYQKGEGVNPMVAFLEETAPTNADTPNTATPTTLAAK